MSKTDLERLSLLEQTDSHIKEALADIRNTLKEMRAFQQEHEKNDKERHEIALNADKELAKAVSDNYVSKEWLKTVGGVIGVLWTIFVFFFKSILEGFRS